MIVFKAITTFDNHLKALLKVKRGVYGGVTAELRNEFKEATIEEIRANRDLILADDKMSVIKLRLTDKKQRLSKKDGYRLIYLVSKTEEKVVFLDIYPKNGPMQQLTISDNHLKQLLQEFIAETNSNLLKDYPIE